MKGYKQVLINEDRAEYEIRALYKDYQPLEEPDSDPNDERKMFKSNDLRSRLKFRRSSKRYGGGESNDKDR